eukprot:336883-Alexandrium_andersonii.AAC.1
MPLLLRDGLIWLLIWVENIMIGGPEEVAIANCHAAFCKGHGRTSLWACRPLLRQGPCSRGHAHHREASQELRHQDPRGLRPRE